MKICSIEDLSCDKNNPRKMTPQARGGLEKSLTEFGDISGIVFNERTGELVSGHQRVAQLKKNGAKIVDNKISAGNDLFSIRVVNWSRKKQTLANLAANNKFNSGVFAGVGGFLELGGASNVDELFRGLNLDLLISDVAAAIDEKMMDSSDVNEIDIDDFKFNNECPRCKFEY